jgi:glutamine cyclotransferase
MKKLAHFAVYAATSALIIIIILFFYWNFTTNNNSPTIYSYTIVASYPHDTGAFTQGLVFFEGSLYESTGGWGTSSLRQVNLADGSIVKEITLSEQYFGEGLTIFNDSLVQLTWQSGIGFVYDQQTLKETGNFTYSTEGWGLTFDGVHLIMSDGTSNLYFLDPSTFQRVNQIGVHDDNVSIDNLNELEYVNGDIYANIWHRQEIVIIDPNTGEVKGYIDLTGIYQTDDPEAVLNGIAYDQTTNSLYVTGKNWPNLYQINITPRT